MHAETLLKLCRVLGIQAEDVMRRETPDRIVLSTPVPVRRLRSLTVELFDDLIRTFGSALELTVGAEGAGPLLQIQRGVPDTDLTTSLERVSALPEGLELQVNVQINKGQILQEFGLDPDRYNGLFYLFLDNVVKLLRGPLHNLDQILFSDAHTPTVVIVSDTKIACRGTLFTVVGGESAQHLQDILPTPSKRHAQRIHRLQGIASDCLHWVGFHLDHLTPLHFLCEFTGEGVEDLANVLVNRLLHLMIVYTANRSSVDGRQIKSLYASSEQSAWLIVSEAALPTRLQGDIARLATWLQAAGEVDKLMMFQNVVAREISGDDPEENFKVFVKRLPNLLRDTRWNYRVYLDGQINKHFEEVQSASSYIAEVTKEIAQSLDSLTKGFVDTLLASVGVVILTLLASLVENKTQGVLFKVGMWAYASYLLIFQVIYRMCYLYRSYSLTVNESEQQLVPFKVALGEKKIEKLTRSLEMRKLDFRRMYWITIGLYTLVIVAILFLGGYLPSAIGQLGVTVPPSASTPGSGISPLPTPSPLP